MLMEYESGILSKKEQQDFDIAIKILDKNIDKIRWIGDVSNLFKVESNIIRIGKWINGYYKGVFDNKSDSFEDCDTSIFIDIAELLDSNIKDIVMRYIMHRIDSDLDGTKTIIAMDDTLEAISTLYVKNGLLSTWLEKLAKYNAIYFLSTHYDALTKHDLTHIKDVLHQFPTQILLPLSHHEIIKGDKANPSKDAKVDTMSLIAKITEIFSLDVASKASLKSIAKSKRQIFIRHNKVGAICSFDVSSVPARAFLLSSNFDIVEIASNIMQNASEKLPFSKFYEEFLTVIGFGGKKSK